jgi:hypothetical protein
MRKLWMGPAADRKASNLCQLHHVDVLGMFRGLNGSNMWTGVESESLFRAVSARRA